MVSVKGSLRVPCRESHHQQLLLLSFLGGLRENDKCRRAAVSLELEMNLKGTVVQWLFFPPLARCYQNNVSVCSEYRTEYSNVR